MCLLDIFFCIWKILLVDLFVKSSALQLHLDHSLEATQDFWALAAVDFSVDLNRCKSPAKNLASHLPACSCFLGFGLVECFQVQVGKTSTRSDQSPYAWKYASDLLTGQTISLPASTFCKARDGMCRSGLVRARLIDFQRHSNQMGQMHPSATSQTTYQLHWTLQVPYHQDVSLVVEALWSAQQPPFPRALREGGYGTSDHLAKMIKWLKDTKKRIDFSIHFLKLKLFSNANFCQQTNH